MAFVKRQMAYKKINEQINKEKIKIGKPKGIWMEVVNMKINWCNLFKYLTLVGMEKHILYRGKDVRL